MAAGVGICWQKSENFTRVSLGYLLYDTVSTVGTRVLYALLENGWRSLCSHHEKNEVDPRKQPNVYTYFKSSCTLLSISIFIFK